MLLLLLQLLLLLLWAVFVFAPIGIVTAGIATNRFRKYVLTFSREEHFTFLLRTSLCRRRNV